MGAHPQLQQLARANGVLTSYTDHVGRRRDAGPEVLELVLRGLGVDLGDGEAGLSAALQRAGDRTWERVLEPTVVAWDGGGSFVVRLPQSARGAYRLDLQCDSGDRREASGALDDLPVCGSEQVAGRSFVARRCPLPGGLPAGYHELSFSAGEHHATALVMSAPRRVFSPFDDAAPHPTTWGAFMPLYALRTPSGAGNLSDLAALTEQVCDQGGSLVGTLPLLATYLDEPFEPSPYVPVSRLFWNEMFLDVRAVGELSSSRRARKLLSSSAVSDRFAALGRADLVDYRAQMALMRPVLEAMCETLMRRPSDRRSAFLEYVQQTPRLDDYATFRAVSERYQSGWHDWPVGPRDGAVRRSDFRQAQRRYHQYVQWNLHQQLGDLSRRASAGGLGLYLDLPVGVHASGYDTWSERDLFVGGVANGAPPDLLFSEGQNWGFQPLHPRRLRERRYDYFIEMIRNHLRYAKVLRIDHLMGLHRLYWIPSGVAARDGVYVSYEAEELYAILSIESHRASALIVGENLGTVPEAVDAAIADHGVRGMHVMQFGLTKDWRGPIRPPTAGSLASFNTHDTPTFRAFVQGDDIDLRVDAGWLAPADAEAERGERAALRHGLERHLRHRGLMVDGGSHDDLVRGCLDELGRSDASIVLVNLEDLWGETRPQNVPGTGSAERPNWRQRAAVALDDLSAEPRVTSALKALDDARNRRTPWMPPPGDVDVETTWAEGLNVHLFNEGTHAQAYRFLGSHVDVVAGVRGTRFAVWAPSAARVSVIGDFNGWDGDRHVLARRGESGVHEGFIKGVTPGALYKYRIVHEGSGESFDKADPYAYMQETPPGTASVVWELDHEWGDDRWMATRAARQTPDAPMSVYEVHLGSWRRVVEDGQRSLTYREIAPWLVEHVKAMGFTHVELMPIMEHPFFGSWGYQVTGYFAPSSRFGTPQDLMYLIDQLHRNDIGVILDWVPSHFPCDAHGLGEFDGTHLYEHADPRKGFHPDWKSYIFNYGRNEVQSFLISSARFWIEAFHVDGIRVDAVASMLYLDYSREDGEWIPNEHGGRENLDAIRLLQSLNDEVHSSFDGVITVAEESTAWDGVTRATADGGLGFDYKWDMGWMHDTLQYLRREPIHRKYHHDELTFRMMYAFTERFVLALSHDEVVHGKGSLLNKMAGDDWQRLASLRLLYAYMWAQPGKKLLFQGQEFGQWAEWDHDSSVHWHLLDEPGHRGLSRWVGRLNELYRSRPALHEQDTSPEGFEWIEHRDAEQSTLVFMRKTGCKSPVVIALNFTPVARHDFRVGLPEGGEWIELASSDDQRFGGAGSLNPGTLVSAELEWQGQPHSVSVTLPPLGAVFLTTATER